MRDLSAQVRALKKYRDQKRGTVYRLVQDNGTVLTVNDLGLAAYYLHSIPSDIDGVPLSRPLRSLERVAGYEPRHSKAWEWIQSELMLPGGVFHVWDDKAKTPR